MQRDGLARKLSTGQRVSLGFYVALIAETYLQAGLIAEAQAMIDDTLAAVPENVIQETYLLPLRGDALARRGASAAIVEPIYRQAIAAARLRDALSEELRATMRLGHFLRAEGRGAEARGLLVPIVARFTEGFDTADLRDARGLVDALAGDAAEARRA